MKRLQPFSFCLFAGLFLLIQSCSTHPQKEEKMESPYLANLEAEHPEEENYAAEYPEVVERLTELYTKWAFTVNQ